MKIVCSWCRKSIGEKEPYEDPSETHGKCSDCIKKQEQKSKALIKEVADVTHPGFPSQELLEKTIKEWQPYYSEPLTLEDAREIIANVCGLFDLLIELNRKQTQP